MSSREMFALPEAWPTVHCSIWLRLTVCCQNIGERFATIAVSCGSYGCSIFFWFAFMPRPPILKYSTMTGPRPRHRFCLNSATIPLDRIGCVRMREDQTAIPSALSSGGYTSKLVAGNHYLLLQHVWGLLSRHRTSRENRKSFCGPRSWLWFG